MHMLIINAYTGYNIISILFYKCSSSINTDLTNGALIESVLCLVLALTPYVEKELGRLTWRVVNKT